MGKEFDLLLKGGTVVSSQRRETQDVGVVDGRIAEIGLLSTEKAREVLDLTGLFVLPGLIDSQVHFREPGAEHKEDLRTGSRAAILGGICSVLEMPNTSPPTTTREAIHDKFRRAQGRMCCDVGFFVGASPENIDALGVLETLPGVPGVKMFMGSSTGSLLIADDAGVEAVLRATRRRVAVHCEDEDRMNQRRPMLGDTASPTEHPVWRDALCALEATRRLLALVKRHDRRVHVLHCTTAEEIEFLADHKRWATVEVTPQHLTLAAPECYERLGTYAQMNPPIRGIEHQQALWRGVEEGVVDVLGSDHAPHTREEKDKGYPNTPSGMPGVQTILPVMLNHVHEGRLSLEKLVQLLAEGPARVWSIFRKGKVVRGYDADFTIVDPNSSWTIHNDWIASKAGWTPFDGMRIHGRPVATILRGQIVMREGEILLEGLGEPLSFDGAGG
ncbi:MAG TPA: dihydroorotase [Planctomycetes bacterium]|nr:dihydroorotase [Planctomycetota bacterium]